MGETYLPHAELFRRRPPVRRNKRQASALSGLKLAYYDLAGGELRMRFFQPVMLVCAVAMSFIGALGLPGCARAIGECLRDKHEMA